MAHNIDIWLVGETLELLTHLSWYCYFIWLRLNLNQVSRDRMMFDKLVREWWMANNTSLTNYIYEKYAEKMKPSKASKHEH